MKNVFYIIIFGCMAFLVVGFWQYSVKKSRITFSYKLFDNLSLKTLSGYSSNRDTLIVDGNTYLVPALIEPKRGNPETILDVYILLDGEKVLLREDQSHKLAVKLREKLDSLYDAEKNLEYLQKEKEKIKKQLQQQKIQEILNN